MDGQCVKSYQQTDLSGQIILEADVEYPKTLWGLHKDLPFLPNRKKQKIKQKNLLLLQRIKKKYVIQISALKEALDHGLIFKKVHRVIEFKQEAWLKPNIDMNTKLRTELGNDFEKKFFKLMNNSVFGKTMKNVRKKK